MKRKLSILVATDHSDTAFNAGRYAMQFAKQAGASVTFLHVYSIPLSFPSGSNDYAKAAEQLRTAEQRRLEQFRNELFHSLNMPADALTTECVVREGNAGSQIRKEAEHIAADFIVVGTHGVNPVKEVFYGTHAWDVIKKSSIPVLAIPIEAVFGGIAHIVFAADYREGEKPAIHFLVNFAEELGAEVTLLHIARTMFSKEYEAGVFRKYARQLKEHTPYEKLNLRLVYYDNAFAGIDNFCTKVKPDMLVMSPERSSWFEKILNPFPSVTKHMSFHTRTPLLTIPDFYREQFTGDGVFDKAEEDF